MGGEDLLPHTRLSFQFPNKRERELEREREREREKASVSGRRKRAFLKGIPCMSVGSVRVRSKEEEAKFIRAGNSTKIATGEKEKEEEEEERREEERTAAAAFRTGSSV